MYSSSRLVRNVLPLSKKLVLFGNELVNKLFLLHDLILGQTEVIINLFLQCLDLLLQCNPLHLIILVGFIPHRLVIHLNLRLLNQLRLLFLPQLLVREFSLEFLDLLLLMQYLLLLDVRLHISLSLVTIHHIELFLLILRLLLRLPLLVLLHIHLFAHRLVPLILLSAVPSLVLIRLRLI